MWFRFKAKAQNWKRRQRLQEIEAQRQAVRDAFDLAVRRKDTRKQHEAAEQARRLTTTALRVGTGR